MTTPAPGKNTSTRQALLDHLDSVRNMATAETGESQAQYDYGTKFGPFRPVTP